MRTFVVGFRLGNLRPAEGCGHEHLTLQSAATCRARIALRVRRLHGSNVSPVYFVTPTEGDPRLSDDEKAELLAWEDAHAHEMGAGAGDDVRVRRTERERAGRRGRARAG